MMRLGVTAIGGSPEEADRIYARAVKILDQEAGAASVPGPPPYPARRRADVSAKKRKPTSVTSLKTKP